VQTVPSPARLSAVQTEPDGTESTETESTETESTDVESTAVELTPDAPAPDALAAPARGPFDWKLLVASLGVAVGIVLVVIGFRSSVSGREQQRLPDAIESIDPISGATQVPQQTRVFVDLQVGYEAELNIDGIDLDVIDLDEVGKLPDPAAGDQQGDQITLPPGAVFERGNVTLTFVPGEGQPVEAFATGQHTATVTYWKTSEGRGKALRYVWSFYVV
jgi:hypothetical protein